MSLGPFLIFDKSSLESLNLDEAVLLDNFYMSNITPIFFVECLADLEKTIRSHSTPEQLVGSLADRTPEAQSYSNVHHSDLLKGELARLFDLTKSRRRVALASGRRVQLGEKKGIIFEPTKEEEARSRWRKREFLDVERTIAKQWRNALTAIDLNAMVRKVMGELGHWRKPKSVEDAKQIADTIVANMDQEWLLRFGLDLLKTSEAADFIVADWIKNRRPPLIDYVPYFIFMLTINIFFCIVLPAQLLRDIKPSHKVDLAYLYYLPFCSVFTSKDNFHKQIAPLFLSSDQTFIDGTELKEDLRKLDAHYSSLPLEILRTGLNHFATHPPEDTAFLTTRLWDRYLPDWRKFKAGPPVPQDPEMEKKVIADLKRMSESPNLQPHDEDDINKLDYVTIHRRVCAKKGKYYRWSEDQIQRMRDSSEGS